MRPDSRRRAPSGIGRTQRSHTVNHCHCPVGRQLPPAVHQLRPAIGSGHYPLLYRTYVRLDGPTQRGPASSRNPRRGAASPGPGWRRNRQNDDALRSRRVVPGKRNSSRTHSPADLHAKGCSPDARSDRRNVGRTTGELPQRASDWPCDGGNVSCRRAQDAAKTLAGTRYPRRILGNRFFRRR